MIVGKCQGFWAMIMGKLTEWAQTGQSQSHDVWLGKLQLTQWKLPGSVTVHWEVGCQPVQVPQVS